MLSSDFKACNDECDVANMHFSLFALEVEECLGFKCLEKKLARVSEGRLVYALENPKNLNEQVCCLSFCVSGFFMWKRVACMISWDSSC